MSGRRGRKKALAKQEQLSNAEADDVILKTESTLKAVAPAPPASPLVTFAAQAISPIVAAARAVSSAAAAALPTIPETQAAVAAQALDVDHDQHFATTPRSPTSPTAMHDPFTGPATLKQTRSRIVSFADGPEAPQEQQDYITDDSQQQHGQPQMQDLEIGGTVHRLNSKSVLISITSCLAATGSHILYTLVLVSLLILLHNQKSAFSRQQSSMLQQSEQVRAQAATLDSLQQQLQDATQRLQDLPDQQQLKTVATTCSAGLHELNTAQALLNSSMGQLKTVSEQLAANITAVSGSAKAGLQAWEVLSAAVAADQTNLNHTAAAAERPADFTTSSPTAATVGGLRLQHALFLQSRREQQTISQQLQESKQLLQSMPSKVRQEVQQQLAAKLPPLDVALADCGAHVLFITAIDTFKQHTGTGWMPSAATFPSMVSASSRDDAEASGAHKGQSDTFSNANAVTAAARATPLSQTSSNTTLQRLHAFVATQLQRLLPSQPSPTANITAAPRGSPERQQQLQEQHMTLQHISRLLLTPAGVAAGSCLTLRLQAGAPAVLEIALPQLMEVHSVTLHHPAPPSSLHDQEQDSAWFSRAPAGVTLALVNSSSCRAAGGSSSTVSGHPAFCSIAGVNSQGFSVNAADSNSSSLVQSGALQVGPTAATDTAATPADTAGTYQHDDGTAGSGSPTPVFVVEGADSIQQEVHLTAERFKSGNGRAVVQIEKALEAAGEAGTGAGVGILADRVIVEISSSLGGADESVCLQRVSVQGVPRDLAAFC